MESTLQQDQAIHGFETEMVHQSLAQALANRFVEHRDKMTEIEEQLRRYKALVDTCPVPVYAADKQGLCIYCNRLFCELTGAKLEQAQHMGWFDFVHPDQRQSVIKDWLYAVNMTKETERTIRFLRPDGKVTEALVKAIKMPHGGWVGFCVPIQFTPFVRWLQGTLDPIPTIN